MIKDTGERILPEKARANAENFLLFLMHWRAYEFILPDIRGLKVMDLGCGEGYGSDLLAQNGAHVTAVDTSVDAITAARQHHRHPNLNFHIIEPGEDLRTIFSGKSFDAVVSLQVIEHVPDPESFLAQAREMLKTGGTFWVATPNAEYRLLPFQNPWNQFHLREYTDATLRTLLEKYFEKVIVQGVSADEELLKIERRRINRNKWLLWPFTNKLIPAGLRQAALLFLKKLTGRERSVVQPEKKPDLEFKDKDRIFLIDESVRQAPVLWARCESRQ